MHMSDALVSPAVAGALWAGAAAAVSLSVRKLNKGEAPESKKIPLMGVMGAFTFAVQMVNFAVPGTGSSGHVSGGLLLAAMLGPQAGFLVMAVVLAIQALFFADGGLLALGCNIVNMGFLTCFVAYPLLFKPILKSGGSNGRIAAAALAAAIAGLQFGAFAVVLETALSGRAELPFGAFALAMQPIHLAIGVVEGLVTAAVLVFLKRAQPEAVAALRDDPSARRGLPKRAIVLMAALAVVCAGALSWFASTKPDGLEWSIAKAAGNATDAKAASADDQRPAGAGLAGSAVTLAFIGVAGVLLVLPKHRKKASR